MDPGTIAAFAAVATALVAAYALRSQTRSVDVSSYLEIVGRFQQYERRLKDARSDQDEHEYALREYLNFLDGIAHLHNTRYFGRRTGSLCWDALCNSIAALEVSEQATTVFESSITSMETFEHLVMFRKKYESKIKERKEIFSSLK